MTNKVSVIILTLNEQENICECLESVSWADEKIVIDAGSVDKTAAIARRFSALVFTNKFLDFSRQRNFGLSKAKGDWVFYLDADERVSPKLVLEIKEKIKSADFTSYKIPRLNIFFGKLMKHGGWYPDYQHRLFRKDSLIKWVGLVHESPEYKGKFGYLKNNLIHLSHQSIAAGFHKSRQWTKIEADLLFKHNHPPVKLLNLIKVSAGEFIDRFFLKKGILDGQVGFLEAIIQAYNKFLIYGQLWEKQQNIGR